MTHYHLVVLVHGLWGNISHFDYMYNALQASATDLDKNDVEQLILYRTSLNEGFKTYDGIDICGIRVAKEIAEQIEEFERSIKGSDGEKITKFSIIGYSLGGLITRYAMGLLYKKQFFKKRDIQLLNFTTFCTPHVGVLAPGHNLAVKLFNSTIPWLLGHSGKQMFLKDSISSNKPRNTSDANEGLPLIYIMSLRDTVFYKALESFKYRSLYANIINDKRTAWWTSGISLNDPFFNINEYNGATVFQYIKGYEKVVVDCNNKILVSKIPNSNLNCETKDEDNNNFVKKTHERDDISTQDFYFINYWFIKIVKWVIVMINLLIIAPLFLFWKIVHFSTEVTISTIRVTRFVNMYSHQILHDFFDITPPSVLDSEDRIVDNESSECDDDYHSLNPIVSRSSSPLSMTNKQQEFNKYLGFEGSLNDQADTLMESIYDAIERKNTHAGFVEEAPSQSGDIDSGSLLVTIRELENTSADQLLKKHGVRFQELINHLFLDLPQRQIEIIKSLNQLNWEKYPIYIRETPSTHACAIVRQIDPTFHEGEIVIKHWIDNVFHTS